MAYQCCLQCKGAVRVGNGALCRGCTRDAQREQLKVGSIGREIAAKRAAALTEMVVAAKVTNQQIVAALEIPVEVLATAAAAQLAAAWGARLKR